jgi:hypothetical protein
VPDSEYVVSTQEKDGMLFELVVPRIEVGMVRDNMIANLMIEPRIRVTRLTTYHSADADASS